MANDRRSMFTFPTKAALDTYVAGKALKGVYTVDIDETQFNMRTEYRWDGASLKLLTNNIKEYPTFADFYSAVQAIVPEGRYLVKSDINNAGLPQEYYGDSPPHQHQSNPKRWHSAFGGHSRA